MIIVMQETATEGQVSAVVDKLLKMGFDIYRTTGARHTVLGAVGEHIIDARVLELLDGVKEVLRISSPYKLASRALKADETRIKIKGVTIGGPEVVVMAGPSAVESRDQLMATAEIVARSGAKILRAAAFKARSAVCPFQGLGEEGLKHLREAADRFDLLVVSEILEESQIPLFIRYVDIMQADALNMQNSNLLSALGRVGKPVLLKRSPGATIEETLMAAECIMSGGNHEVIICERGIRALEPRLLSAFDISAVPQLKKLSHLPVIADPSHATGRRDLVASVAQAAVAAGADGLVIDVHNDPDNAVCDGAQSLRPEQFEQLMRLLRLIAEAVGRSVIPTVAEQATSNV